MGWLILVLAGVLEIGWAVGLKASQGLTKPGLAILTIVTMLGSFVLLGIAIRTIPLGTGYAVWTGIGAVGTVILGAVLFNESLGFWRLMFLAMILVGIIGLKFVENQN